MVSKRVRSVILRQLPAVFVPRDKGSFSVKEIHETPTSSRREFSGTQDNKGNRPIYTLEGEKRERIKQRVCISCHGR